jgi:ABC-type amino acid transport system permease subunit
MFDVLFERGFDGRLCGQYLLSGLGWTLALAIPGWCIAFSVGTVVGIGRTVSNRMISAASRPARGWALDFVTTRCRSTGGGRRLEQVRNDNSRRR